MKSLITPFLLILIFLNSCMLEDKDNLWPDDFPAYLATAKTSEENGQQWLTFSIRYTTDNYCFNSLNIKIYDPQNREVGEWDSGSFEKGDKYYTDFKQPVNIGAIPKETGNYLIKQEGRSCKNVEVEAEIYVTVHEP